jgi:hypothetical protein
MLLGNMKTHPPEVKIEPRKKTAEQMIVLVLILVAALGAAH